MTVYIALNHLLLFENLMAVLLVTRYEVSSKKNAIHRRSEIIMADAGTYLLDGCHNYLAYLMGEPLIPGGVL